MRCDISLNRRWLAAVVVLLAGAATADAQTNRVPPPAWANPGGSGGTAQRGATTPARPTRPQNLGVWSSDTATGSTRPGAATGGTGGFGGGTGGFTGGFGGGGFGGSSAGSLGGLGFAGLLTPEQELMVLIDALITAEGLIDQVGIEFRSELEVLFFVLMIYQMKYQEAVQTLLGGGTGGDVGGAGVGFPFPVGGVP